MFINRGARLIKAGDVVGPPLLPHLALRRSRRGLFLIKVSIGDPNLESVTGLGLLASPATPTHSPSLAPSFDSQSLPCDVKKTGASPTFFSRVLLPVIQSFDSLRSKAS